MNSGEIAGLVISVAVTLVSAGAVYGVLSERVRKMGSDLEQKIDRKEFEAGMARLEELHRDLREIRDLLMRVLQGGKP